MQGNFNYLQKSFEMFPRLTGIMFGWEYNMTEIENKLSNVRENDRLERKDLLRIRDAGEWDYKKFWPDLESAINLEQSIRGIFKLGWEERKKTISDLYKQFLHIEVVSVILRFVDPQNYAIISPPVEKFFSLQPQDDHVEYYINYLNLLKKTSRHLQSPKRLADVDMALWSLTHILKNWSDKEFRTKWTEEDRSIIELILECYKSDLFFKKIRLIEALKQAYQDIEVGGYEPNRILLAECLDSEMIDPELAMLIVSYSFENLLWELIMETGREKEFLPILSRKEWIKNLKEDKIFKTFPIFRECVDLRNRAVHPWLKKLNAVEREEFIAKLEDLITKKKANNL